MADPLAKALGSRIAYGQVPPYYSSGGGFLGPSSPFIPTPYGYETGAFGGFDPKMLLLLGGGLALVLMLSRR